VEFIYTSNTSQGSTFERNISFHRKQQGHYETTLDHNSVRDLQSFHTGFSAKKGAIIKTVRLENYSS